MPRRPKPVPVTATPLPVLPRWIRQQVGGDDPEAAIFAAGAALSALDGFARSAQPPGQLWRRRLALGAALAISALEGRRENEGQLRDAFALRRAGDDPGPAGRLLEGWRALAETRALRTAEWPARLPGYFDLSPTALAGPLTAAAARLPRRVPPLRFAAGLATPVLALGPAHRGLALWLADAGLAQALGWDRPVPLLAAYLPRAAFRLEGDAWAEACARAWGKAAVQAFDLYSELSRRADALTAAAPKLRGRDAAATVRALLSEDALAAQAGERASDRAARRLFERLTTAGLVRELTGRPTFRLYGL